VPGQSISGRVTDNNGNGLGGISVSITGSKTATTLTSSSGNYSFTGLSAVGSYTVTPSSALYIFSPSSLSFGNLIQSRTASFTGTRRTYAIGGAVTADGAGLGGIVFTLTSTTAGFTPRTVTTAASTGAYSFNNLPAGQSYVLKPSSDIYGFTPVNKNFTNLSANQTGQNFTAARKTYSIGGKVLLGASALSGYGVTLTSAAAGFTPRTVATLSDGSYSFTGLPAGDAYTVTPAASNVYSFTPASRSYSSLTGNQAAQNFTAAYKTYTISGSVLQGTSGLGGVTVTLTSTTAGFTARSVVSAASTGAYTFTGVPAGRTYVVTPSSSIYTFTPVGRTLSALSSNLTGQNFNVASRKTYAISGRLLLGSAGLSGYSVQLTSTDGGVSPRSVTTLSDGSYSFNGLPAGYAYTITPAAGSIYSLTPASRSYTNLSANQTAQNFTVTRKTYPINGRLLFGSSGLGSYRLTLTSSEAGAPVRSVTTAADGSFSFPAIPAGFTYTLAPIASNIYSFTPVSRSYTNLSAAQAGQNFTAARKTYSISGRVTRTGTTTGIGAVTMTLTNSSTGAVVKTVTTATDGSYSLTAIPAGITYALRPTRTGTVFSPTSRTYTNLSADQPVGPGTSFTGG
jgi:hypothetical protein